MASVDAFQSSIRVQIGLALRAGPLTAQEIAKTLGRPTGGIFGAVRRMLQEGLLEASADPPGRGTQYWLTPAAAAALRAALSEREQPGVLRPGQQLLLVEPPVQLADALGVFARDEVAGREEQQIRCRPLTLERLLPGSELRARADWLREVADSPQ
jgi:DNA-binding MarR family transcriptional regulator